MQAHPQIKQLRHIPFDPEEFAFLAVETQRKARDLSSVASIVAGFYKDNTSKGQAFMERMLCLKEIARDPKLAWMAQDDESKKQKIKLVLIHAAALTPVQVEDGKQFFDVDEFNQIARLEYGAWEAQQRNEQVLYIFSCRGW